MYRNLRTAFGVLILTALCQPADAATAVAIKTSSNVSGSGTDSNVYIKLVGTKGESKRLRLQDYLSGNILENGSFDTFIVPDDLGAIMKIYIESQGDYSGSDWHLDFVRCCSYDGSVNGAESAAKMFVSTGKVGPELRMGHLVIGRIPAATMDNAKFVISTFKYENWIKGGETIAEEGGRAGVRILRDEAPVVELETKSEPAKIFVVYTADAIGSGKEVTRAWKSTISASDTFEISDETTNRAQIGANVEYGYSPAEATGGHSVRVGLSAEYEYLKAKVQSKSQNTTKQEERDETFSADPGTLEVRILSGFGTVQSGKYRSALTGDTFTANYANASSLASPAQYTFTAGKLDNDKWNMYVARPYFEALGAIAYNDLTSKMKNSGILTYAMTPQQIARGEQYTPQKVAQATTPVAPQTVAQQVSETLTPQAAVTPSQATTPATATRTIGVYSASPLTLRSIAGTYRYEPYSNNWHQGTITVESNGQLRWTNQAGVSWNMNPDLQTGVLQKEAGSPYQDQPNGQTFVVQRDGSGNITGFQFQGETYKRM